MRLLLDTCTFLWIVGGAPELSARARQAFADPGNEVYLSAASAWEIAVKHRLGRLPLPETPDRFVPRARDAHGIDRLDIDEALLDALAARIETALRRMARLEREACVAVCVERHAMWESTEARSTISEPLRQEARARCNEALVIADALRGGVSAA